MPNRAIHPSAGSKSKVKAKPPLRRTFNEVMIPKDKNDVILTPRPSDWNDFLASEMKASADFMNEVECLPLDERSFERGTFSAEDPS